MIQRGPESSHPGLAFVPTEGDEGEWVAREEPLLLDIDGERVLTMRTPGEDEALALGFLLGEGIVSSREEVLSVELVPGSAPLPDASVDVVRVRLVDPKRARGASGKLSRAHEIRASCGLCGRSSAEGLVSGLRPLAQGEPRVSIEALRSMLGTLVSHQEIFRKTGGSHAAGIFSPGGELWAVSEDVGRHNALDKAIGKAAFSGRDLPGGIAILSGRGGFELVLKALRVGIAVIASVSASSSLAIDIADEAQATLVGFLREEQAPRVYTDWGRIA